MCIVCGSGTAHLVRAFAAPTAPPPHGASRFAARAVAPPVVPPLDPAAEADLAGPADVILHGGAVLTMSEATPSAEAVAVRAGRIQAVGSEPAVLAHRGRLTRIIDLQGRALLPGFINAHWHVPFTVLCAWVDARAGVLAALAQAVATAPPGEWIVLATGAAVAASQSALDAASPAHRVLVTRPDGGIVAGNAMAIADAGGMLPAHVGALLGRFAARLAVSREPVHRRLAALLRQTAAAGITCLRICGLGTLAGAEDIVDLLRAVADTAAPLRLRATLDAALLPDWRALQLAPRFGDDMFRVDTLSGWPGEEADAAAGLAARLRTARDGGWRVTAHAPHTAHLPGILDGLALSGAAFDAGCGIECRQMPPPSHLAQLRRLGLSLGLTVSDDAQPPADASGRMDDASALPLSLGLDAAIGPSSPLRMIHCAVAGGYGARLTLAQALRAVTIDAARRCGTGDILGSLDRGKYADLVFLDRDPRRLAAADLATLTCRATWVNGREAFRAWPSPPAAMPG